MLDKLLISLVLLVSLLLSGCATTDQARQDLIDSLSESERAYLIGKFTVQCRQGIFSSKCMQTFNSMSLSYKSTGEIEFYDRLNSTSGSIFGSNTEHDIIDLEKEERSFYFCEILPSGDYSFFTARYWNFAGGGGGYYLDEEDYFDVPFRLDAEKISLVGSLKLTSEKGKNLLGLPLEGPGQLEISPLPDEEVELAIQKCPEIAQSYEVIPQRISEKNFASPFVVTKLGVR